MEAVASPAISSSASEDVFPLAEAEAVSLWGDGVRGELAGISRAGGWHGEDVEWCSRRSLINTATFERQSVARSVRSPKAFALQFSDLETQRLRKNGGTEENTSIMPSVRGFSVDEGADDA